MSFWRRIFGPRSKYDRRLPYTYEARVTVSGVDGMSDGRWSDLTGARPSASGRIAETGVDAVDAVLVRSSADRRPSMGDETTNHL